MAEASHLALGRAGEEIAARYLESIGYNIVDKNVKLSLGEIDLVAQDGNFFVLVEVKTGKTGLYGYAFERVGPHKTHKLRQLAKCWEQKYPNRGIRIDLINVDDHGEIIHIKNAIECRGL